MEPRIPYTKLDKARVSYDRKADAYYIQEGLTKTASGKVGPRKFRLGSDEAEARERALRIRTLWQELRAKGSGTWPDDVLVDEDGEPSYGEIEKVLRAIEKGDWTAVRAFTMLAQLGASLPGPLAKTFKVPSEAIAKEIQADSLPKKKTATAPSGTGLHKAIEDFATATLKEKTDLETGKPTAWASTLSGQIRRLKDATPDMALASFREEQIKAIADYWKSRPCRKGTGRRIDITTVQAQIKSLRYFCKWLRKNRQWRRPEDLEDVLTVRSSSLKFKDEIAALAQGIPHYSVSELVTLWRYSTQWERLFLLLSLNCGFAQAEIASLRVNEVCLDSNPPVIKRIRQKRQVFGQVALSAR